MASTEQASGDAPIQIDSNYQEEIINESEIQPEYQEPPAPLAPEPEPPVEPEPVVTEEPQQGNVQNHRLKCDNFCRKISENYVCLVQKIL